MDAPYYLILWNNFSHQKFSTTQLHHSKRIDGSVFEYFAAQFIIRNSYFQALMVTGRMRTNLRLITAHICHLRWHLYPWLCIGFWCLWAAWPTVFTLVVATNLPMKYTKHLWNTIKMHAKYFKDFFYRSQLHKKLSCNI